MALQLPSLHPPLHGRIPSPLITQPLPRILFAHRSLIPMLKTSTRIAKPRHHVIAAVTKDDSLSTMITELEEEEKEEEANGAAIPNDRLAERWREIHGRDNWAGLLDPIDPLLRSELIRYGEFTQATYDAFDFDIFSRYCGCCKYPRRRFFASLGMADAGYEVTRYLYATADIINLPKFSTHSRLSRAWSERANWIGYVAVSGDVATARLGRRDVVVAWRGTVTKMEWVADLMDFLRPVVEVGIPSPDGEVKVESGFMQVYTDKDPSCRFGRYSAREQVLTEVRRLVRQYTEAGEEVSVTVTGHSLGSALATLSAYDIAETGLVDGQAATVCVFSFAGPRVGNEAFKDRLEALGVKVLRVLNVHDKVPKVPGMLFNERVPALLQKLVDDLPWTYSHVGVELALDHKNSPFLRDTNDISCFHNMEAHLHLLDGYHGSNQKFMSASGRDPALINKSCDFLKDDHLVPPNWLQDANKGMIQSSDGRWVLPERPKITDDHPHDIHHHLQQLGLGSK